MTLPDLITPQSRFFAGVLLVSLPSIAFGGASLLWMLRQRDPGYVDNPARKALFRAGHAHAGVLVILALVGMLWVDAAHLTATWKTVARLGLAAAPIFISAGFFFSILPSKQSKPGPLLGLVYVGATALVVATVTLGIGLFRA